jgi:hypothetical protein
MACLRTSTSAREVTGLNRQKQKVVRIRDEKNPGKVLGLSISSLIYKNGCQLKTDNTDQCLQSASEIIFKAIFS